MAAESSFATRDLKVGDNSSFRQGHNYYAPVTINNKGPEDTNAKILKALSLTKPIDDKIGLIARKGNIVPGTCEWLTDRPEYKKWLSSSMSRILWLSGGPGKGKTMLSIYLTDVLEEYTKPSDGTLLYYFCDSQKRNTPVAILGGLLRQLLEKQSRLFKYILSDFKVQGEGLTSSLNALWRIFTTMLQDSGLQEVLCVLDGLDECDECKEGSLELFLKMLKDFFSRTGNAPSTENVPSTENFKLLVVELDSGQSTSVQFGLSARA